MTDRAKQISTAANREYAHSYKVEAFIKGATWSDENPARDPNEPHYVCPNDDVEKLKARVKRLEAALENITDSCGEQRMYTIARKALEESSD